ncbi:hypothetical protein EVAR_21467_1 [Eumeta japonica]|uniref:Uncharacterized protein n=1 Tax=Eumeta variegata TaxID=151549 RepID=A0A4C1VHH9_EUMVA|nr:hypothetical protein EVAR_21467_1 [Eumeta japonica]
MENRELAETAYKPRKRVFGIRNSENYKQNKIKKAKISGEAHKNHKGNDVASRQTGASCRDIVTETLLLPAVSICEHIMLPFSAHCIAVFAKLDMFKSDMRCKSGSSLPF